MEFVAKKIEEVKPKFAPDPKFFGPAGQKIIFRIFTKVILRLYCCQNDLLAAGAENLSF